MKTNIFNIVILDQSGSMSCIKQQAINGYNETVQTIKVAQQKHIETQNHFITLVVFDSTETKTVFNKVPCQQAEELNGNTYHPNANTPLYDAMGMTLSKFHYQLDEKQDNKILVTIITDGEENASREYTGQMIRKLIEELKTLGWVFTYIGANQDVEKVAATISITNVMNFASTEMGTDKMFACERKSRSSFYDRIASNECNESLLENYFEDEE